MREKFLIMILVIAAGMTDLGVGVSAQDAATKAQQLINQALDLVFAGIRGLNSI